MFQGANTLECESFRERKFPGQFALGNESSREREGQGAKGPGSERSRERIGQGPIGRFAPGSELARERKGCESFATCLLSSYKHIPCKKGTVQWVELIWPRHWP